MSDSRQPGSPGVDLDALEPLVLDGRIALTRDDEPGDEGPSEELVALVAELRTLRARVAELETPYGPMLSASERDMYRARVSELETETIALRARVGELEVPDAEADRILTMSAEELDAEIRAVGIDPAELDKRASHVAKWAAECSKLRARVGGLEAQGAWEAVYKEEHQLRREAEARAESAEARVKELEAQYAAIAHAVGVEHAPDTGPTHPGPFAAVLASVEENARNAGRYWELESEVARLREARVWVNKAIEEKAGTSHYAHHDPMGTAGANCPACHASVRLSEALRAARKILEVEKGGSGG